MTRLSAIFSLLFVATVLYAEEMPLWKTVGGWQIRVDTTIGNGCFTYQFYEGGTFIRVGINKLVGGVYIMVGDADWKSLEAGKQYPIKLYFGNETPWRGDATAVDFSGLPTLMLRVTSKDSAAKFLQEFMREISVNIIYKGKSIANLSLKGTYKAASEMLECQKVINEAQEKVDPFDNSGGSAGGADDPFAI